MRTLNIALAGSVACLVAFSGRVAAQEPTVTPLIAKALADIPGKEVVMITVEYAPGSADRVHRHNANAFVYVLEGSVVMAKFLVFLLKDVGKATFVPAQ